MLRRLIDGISYRLTRLSLRRKALKLHAANLMRLEIPAASCLYLCYGNIMRSPFAENLAKVQRSELRIGGGGFHPNTGRECPPACVATAQRFDIDLGTHRSRAVTIDDVRSFDVIFVTDLRVLGLLLEQFPSAADRVLMLGLFGAAPSVEIPDPWGHELEIVQACYRRIYSAVSDVCRRIPKR